MFFRILLIGMISWAIFKLYRILIGSGTRGASAFQRGSQNGRYKGKAVDAQFEELNDDADKPGDG